MADRRPRPLPPVSHLLVLLLLALGPIAAAAASSSPSPSPSPSASASASAASPTPSASASNATSASASAAAASTNDGEADASAYNTLLVFARLAVTVCLLFSFAGLVWLREAVRLARLRVAATARDAEIGKAVLKARKQAEATVAASGDRTRYTVVYVSSHMTSALARQQLRTDLPPPPPQSASTAAALAALNATRTAGALTAVAQPQRCLFGLRGARTKAPALRARSASVPVVALDPLPLALPLCDGATESCSIASAAGAGPLSPPHTSTSAAGAGSGVRASRLLSTSSPSSSATALSSAPAPAPPNAPAPLSASRQALLPPPPLAIESAVAATTALLRSAVTRQRQSLEAARPSAHAPAGPAGPTSAPEGAPAPLQRGPSLQVSGFFAALNQAPPHYNSVAPAPAAALADGAGSPAAVAAAASAAGAASAASISNADLPRDPPRPVRWPLVLEILVDKGACDVCAEENVTIARLAACSHLLCTACVSRMVKPLCPFCRAPLCSADPLAAERV